jgi:hypothetical protein
MTEHSSTNAKPSHRAVIAGWAGVVALGLSVAYTLSMGPALWLANHGYLPMGVRQFLSNFYTPLWVVASYVRPLKEFLHWYMSLWQ